MPVRQVQADEVPRHHLREVRRRSDAGQGAARAHGPYRAREPSRAYLVPEVAAQPDRPDGRPDAEGAREDPVLRELRGAGARAHRPQAAPAADRRAAAGEAGRIRRRRVPRRHRRRGDQDHPARHRCRRGEGEAARRAQGHQQRGAAQEAGQAPEADRGVRRFRGQARVDDHGRGAGDSAGAAPAGAARRWPVRDQRPQRPVSPRHQPQQPPEAADRAARARHHRAQREAHAAGER